MGHRKLTLLTIGVLLAVSIIAATASAGGRPSSVDPTEIAPTADNDTVNRQIPGNQSSAHVPAAFVPRPAPLAVAGTGAELGTNFSGVNFRNQRIDSDSTRQFSLEPPDQGLCVGNGEVIEPVNDTFAVYDAATGAKTSGFESMNQFFVGDHQIIRTPSVVFGTFISDPKCIYDPGSGRFFMTVLTIGRNPSTGAFVSPFTLRIATSKTGTPAASPSDWSFTTIDVTNDGSNGVTHPNCPCLGDQPLLGSDANGVYVTTNEFPWFVNGFNGAQIYAVQKSALVAGTTPNIQRIEGAPITPNYGEGIPYSLQPATSPSAADYATASSGTEYLLGALEFGRRPFQLDDRIAVWALTNTASLNTATPAIAVSTKVISSQVYGLPGNIVQQKGPTPLGDSLKEHETLIDGGDDRMQAAVYAHGFLWGAGDTTLKTPTGSSQVGITYYVVAPSVTGSAVDGSVVKQGYLSVERTGVTRPSLAVTSAGKAVIGVSLIGPDYYPSAAYATLDDTLTTSPSTLHLVASGAKPADGLSGYYSFGASGVERWGDYAAAAADGTSIWVANEWIQGNVVGLLANWNTFVSKVTP